MLFFRCFLFSLSEHTHSMLLIPSPFSFQPITLLLGHNSSCSFSFSCLCHSSSPVTFVLLNPLTSFQFSSYQTNWKHLKWFLTWLSGMCQIFFPHTGWLFLLCSLYSLLPLLPDLSMPSASHSVFTTWVIVPWFMVVNITLSWKTLRFTSVAHNSPWTTYSFI